METLPFFPERIRTSRLLLRPPRPHDAVAIFQRYATDPEVTKYLVWQPHRSMDETRAFVDDAMRAWHRGIRFPWVITRNTDWAVLGMIEARLSGAEVEFGYVLAREEWRKGYMTEALKALTDLAFHENTIQRVYALTDLDNAASAALLKKAAFEQTTTLPRHTILPALGPDRRDMARFEKKR
ncbi:GNAT family N-acetyltransferase [soil metagenome]